MKNFIQHWKKGWKLLLFELCLVFAYALIILPAIIAQVILNWSMSTCYIAIVIISAILAPAVTQYLFEVFYGACRRQ